MYVQYSHQGKEILICSKNRHLAEKTYGIPILFPTPNPIAGPGTSIYSLSHSTPVWNMD